MRRVLFGLQLFLVVSGLGCSTGRTEVPYQIIHANYGVDDPQFRRTLGNLLGPPLLEGNSLTTYVNGDAFYPPMLAAIRSARKTITFETFVYWKGEMGEAFTSALCERARAGVKVHVTIDAVGSERLGGGYLKRLGGAWGVGEGFFVFGGFDI